MPYMYDLEVLHLFKDSDIRDSLAYYIKAKLFHLL
jgi:hypothetical protein